MKIEVKKTLKIKYICLLYNRLQLCKKINLHIENTQDMKSKIKAAAAAAAAVAAATASYMHMHTQTRISVGK